MISNFKPDKACMLIAWLVIPQPESCNILGLGLNYSWNCCNIGSCYFISYCMNYHHVFMGVSPLMKLFFFWTMSRFDFPCTCRPTTGPSPSPRVRPTLFAFKIKNMADSLEKQQTCSAWSWLMVGSRHKLNHATAKIKSCRRNCK